MEWWKLYRRWDPLSLTYPHSLFITWFLFSPVHPSACRNIIRLSSFQCVCHSPTGEYFLYTGMTIYNLRRDHFIYLLRYRWWDEGDCILRPCMKRVDCLREICQKNINFVLYLTFIICIVFFLWLSLLHTSITFLTCTRHFLLLYISPFLSVQLYELIWKSASLTHFMRSASLLFSSLLSDHWPSDLENRSHSARSRRHHSHLML